MKEITDDLLTQISRHIFLNKTLYGTNWRNKTQEDILNVLRTMNINFIETPGDFYTLKGAATIIYYCRSCGSIVFSPNGFRVNKINNLSKMLCAKCRRIDTCMDNFGCDNPMKNKDIVAKGQETWKSKSKEEFDDIQRRKGETRRNKPQEEKDKTTAKVKATKLKNHGDPNYNNQEKYKQTMNERYNIDHPFQYKPFYQKMCDSKLKNHGDPYFNNLEKRRDTCQKRYGTNNACEAPEVIEKINDATVLSLGVKRPLQSQKYLNKMQCSMNDKYGGKTTMESPILKNKVQSTNIEKYGSVCCLGNKTVREKAKQTLIENTGRDHPIVNKLNYYGVSFDSKWELAVWIYAKDHNEFIVREPIAIPYVFKNEIHYGHPDFYYRGQIIEIKGEHLYDETSNFDTKHKNKNIIKNKAEEQAGVVFWFSKDIKYAIDYVHSVYGKDYLNRFYSTNPHNPSYSDLYGYIPIVKPYHLMHLFYSMPIVPCKGVTPFDIKQEEKYAPITGKGLTSFDI